MAAIGGRKRSRGGRRIGPPPPTKPRVLTVAFAVTLTVVPEIVEVAGESKVAAVAVADCEEAAVAAVEIPAE